jgi:hypothetical protein
LNSAPDTRVDHFIPVCRQMLGALGAILAKTGNGCRREGFFHVTTAYALLRHNGVDIGKRSVRTGCEQLGGPSLGQACLSPETAAGKNRSRRANKCRRDKNRAARVTAGGPVDTRSIAVKG